MPIPKFTLRGFRRPREVAAQALGKLEREVLDEIWRRDEGSVRDVYLAFGESVAYTTVMTTLDRLYKKRLLTRRKDGRAFIYRPVVDREQARESAVKHLLGRFFENSPELLMLNLLESNQVAPEELKRLRERIDEETEA